MTLRTALEISSNIDNLLITTSKTDEHWLSQLYLLRDGSIHKLLLSVDINGNFKGWDTEEEAKNKMQEIINLTVNSTKEY